MPTMQQIALRSGGLRRKGANSAANAAPAKAGDIVAPHGFGAASLHIATLGTNPSGPRPLNGNGIFRTAGPRRTANPIAARHG